LASETPELPNAKKWFNGFFDVTRYIKDFGAMLRFVIIVGIIYLLILGSFVLYKKYTTPKQKTTIGEVSGGKIDASTCDTKTKIGVVNF
jgi:arginine exporter protein ArgO